jgi:DNA repair ATPase RecN
MTNRNLVHIGQPTTIFWNCIGLSLVIFSMGMSWAICKTKQFDLELAQYNIRTGNAIFHLQEVSDTLEQSAKTLPIAPKKKQEIQKQLAESSAVINEASSEVEELVEP